MHLEFNSRGKARPNGWIVIDDFGTEHDALLKEGDFGGYSEPAARTRREFLDSGLCDPDYNRAFWSTSMFYRACESVAFASPIGMSIELDIRIDFELQPAWNERTHEPLWTQAEGAAIHIIRADTDCWEFSPSSTVLTQKALEAFCWAYIDMEKARNDAGHRISPEAEQ